jgi:hypothetical protein
VFEHANDTGHVLLPRVDLSQIAPDSGTAAAEMARITASDGRIVLGAWIPEGAISEASRIGREAVAAALGTVAGPRPFAWHDLDALSTLLGSYGFTVTADEHVQTFTAASVRDWSMRSPATIRYASRHARC